MRSNKHILSFIVVSTIVLLSVGVASTAAACETEHGCDYSEESSNSEEPASDSAPATMVAPPDCEIDADCGPCGICDAEAFDGGWGYCYWEVWGDECEEEIIVEPDCYGNWDCGGCNLCVAGTCVAADGFCNFDVDCGALERCSINLGNSCQNTCVPMTEHEALCTATGGDWNTCGACGPTTCESHLAPPVLCPAVCLSLCGCPADAPIWDGEAGCLPASICDAGNGIDPVIGVTLKPQLDGSDLPGRGCAAADGPFGTTSLILVLCAAALAVMRRRALAE